MLMLLLAALCVWSHPSIPLSVDDAPRFNVPLIGVARRIVIHRPRNPRPCFYTFHYHDSLAAPEDREALFQSYFHVLLDSRPQRVVHLLKVLARDGMIDQTRATPCVDRQICRPTKHSHPAIHA